MYIPAKLFHTLTKQTIMPVSFWYICVIILLKYHYQKKVINIIFFGAVFDNECLSNDELRMIWNRNQVYIYFKFLTFYFILYYIDSNNEMIQIHMEYPRDYARQGRLLQKKKKE